MCFSNKQIIFWGLIRIRWWKPFHWSDWWKKTFDAIKILNSNLSKVKMISCFYKSKKKTSFKDFASRIFDSKKELPNQGTVGPNESSWERPRPNSSSGRDDSEHHKNHSKNNRKTLFSILFTWTKTATGCHWSQELSGCYTRFWGNCCRSPVTKNHNYTVWSTSLPILPKVNMTYWSNQLFLFFIYFQRWSWILIRRKCRAWSIFRIIFTPPDWFSIRLRCCK